MKGIKSFIKYLLVILGFISLFLGILGIFIPLLPTTPFILLAAACFSRSSGRFYNNLLQNKYLGQYIRDYREGRGIPARAKVLALLLLWAAIGYSASFLLNALWIRILLVILAVAVTVHILSIKTLQAK